MKISLVWAPVLIISCASDLDVESAGLWAPPDRRDGWSHKYSDPAAPTVRNKQIWEFIHPFIDASLKKIPELNIYHFFTEYFCSYLLYNHFHIILLDCVPARCRCTCWRSPSGRSCLLPQSTPWWIPPGSEGRNRPSDRPLHTPFFHHCLLQEMKIKVRCLFLYTNRKILAPIWICSNYTDVDLL